MTLAEIKNEIQYVCLENESIKEFNFGEEFEVDNGGDNSFPFAFLEIPYLVNYELPANRFKNISFALDILIYKNVDTDGREQDHQAISDAEEIGEQIVTTLQQRNNIYFDIVTGVSLRRFSGDAVSGFRLDFIVKTTRNYCA